MLKCLILLNSDLHNDSIRVMCPISVSLPTFSTLSMNDNEEKVVHQQMCENKIRLYIPLQCTHMTKIQVFSHVIGN